MTDKRPLTKTARKILDGYKKLNFPPQNKWFQKGDPDPTDATTNQTEKSQTHRRRHQQTKIKKHQTERRRHQQMMQQEAKPEKSQTHRRHHQQMMQQEAKPEKSQTHRRRHQQMMQQEAKPEKSQTHRRRHQQTKIKKHQTERRRHQQMMQTRSQTGKEPNTPATPPINETSKQINELFETELKYQEDLRQIIRYFKKLNKESDTTIKQNGSINPHLKQIFVKAETYLTDILDNSNLIKNHGAEYYMKKFLTYEKSNPAFDFLDKIANKKSLNNYLKYNQIYSTFFIYLSINNETKYKLITSVKSLEEGTLGDHLIKPVQRVMRYPLVFNEIVAKYKKEEDFNKKEANERLEMLTEYQTKMKKFANEFNKFTFFNLIKKFELLYSDGKSFNDTYFKKKLPYFPFKIELNFDEKMEEVEQKMEEVKKKLKEDEKMEEVKKKLKEDETKLKKDEKTKEEFLELIFQGISNSSAKKSSVGYTNHEKSKCTSSRLDENMRKEFESILLDEKSLMNFKDFIIKTKKKHNDAKKKHGDAGNMKCQDILMQLIVFEQASTFYIARCIKSKYPNSYFAIDKIQSSLSGLWKHDKDLLKEGEIPQTGGSDKGDEKEDKKEDEKEDEESEDENKEEEEEEEEEESEEEEEQV